MDVLYKASEDMPYIENTMYSVDVQKKSLVWHILASTHRGNTVIQRIEKLSNGNTNRDNKVIIAKVWHYMTNNINITYCLLTRKGTNSDEII